MVYWKNAENNLEMCREKSMKYSIYKLEFQTGVHFGKGMLNDSACTFRADTLFSALYIEACKAGMEKEFYQSVVSGQLLFSDAFPYVNDQYMIPKPMLYIESDRKGDSVLKKKFKKLNFFPVEQLGAYMSGTMELDENPMDHFGFFVQKTVAAVRRDEETLPYQVGTYHYNKGNGLYIIVGYCSDTNIQITEELLNSVSLGGIGGKKSSGLGKFILKKGKENKCLLERLQKSGRYSMLLSAALPTEDEMPMALEGASYLLEKRSGFVASDTYAEEFRRKKDLYIFASGSCFENRFSGGVYDVSEGGCHPVYRYAIPLFMGV